MLELHHFEPNTFFLKPLVALAEADAPFTSRYFDPTKFEQFAPGFPESLESRLQLEREGPVLVADGAVLASSFFMLEYITDAFPAARLRPSSAYDQYRAQAWGQFVALQIGPAVCALGCAKYLTPVLKARAQEDLAAQLSRIEPVERRSAWTAVIDGSRDEAALARVRMRLATALKRVEDALGKSTWLAGPTYSIADIDAYAMIAPLPDLAPAVVSEKETPGIMGFLARVRERPAIEKALSYARTQKPAESFVPGAEPSRWG
jgi:glutathione S-transferase